MQKIKLVARESEEVAFNRAFRSRVVRAREDAGLTQVKMAAALGIEKDAYKKYEYRSPLPAYLMVRFSIITGKSLAWLLSGRG